MRTVVKVGLVWMAWGGAPAVFAHDFWIEPAKFQAQPGSVISIGLRVGEHFKGEAVPRKSDRIDRFVLVGADGEKPMVGRDGDATAGLVRIESPGMYVIGYRSKASSIELDAAKFEAYLREEGLDAIIKARAADGQSDAPAREIYSRCAKSIVTVGDTASQGFDRPIGFRLELTPEQNPSTVLAGGELPVRLLYEGKPAADVLVVAMCREKPSEPVRARTDADGRVHLPIAQAGAWLVKAVHMVRAKDAALADWESLWASLTFESRPVDGGRQPRDPE